MGKAWPEEREASSYIESSYIEYAVSGQRSRRQLVTLNLVTLSLQSVFELLPPLINMIKGCEQGN